MIKLPISHCDGHTECPVGVPVYVTLDENHTLWLLLCRADLQQTVTVAAAAAAAASRHQLQMTLKLAKTKSDQVCALWLQVEHDTRMTNETTC